MAREMMTPPAMGPMDPSMLSPDVVSGQERIAAEEDRMMMEFQPKGDFSRKPLNALVVVTRKMQPLFGLEGDYPRFDSDLTELPVEFVRVLSMFKQAIDDAIAQDILDEADAFMLEDIRDDSSLKLLAGKLNKVLRDKKFKKFLEAKPAMEETEEEETEMRDEERTPMPSGAEEMDLDALFMERM